MQRRHQQGDRSSRHQPQGARRPSGRSQAADQRRLSGSEWERQGEYRMRLRWLSLYTKDEAVARQHFDALKAEFSGVVEIEDERLI